MHFQQVSPCSTVVNSPACAQGNVRAAVKTQESIGHTSVVHTRIYCAQRADGADPFEKVLSTDLSAFSSLLPRAAPPTQHQQAWFFYTVSCSASQACARAGAHCPSCAQIEHKRHLV